MRDKDNSETYARHRPVPFVIRNVALDATLVESITIPTYDKITIKIVLRFNPTNSEAYYVKCEPNEPVTDLFQEVTDAWMEALQRG